MVSIDDQLDRTQSSALACFQGSLAERKGYHERGALSHGLGPYNGVCEVVHQMKAES